MYYRRLLKVQGDTLKVQFRVAEQHLLELLWHHVKKVKQNSHIVGFPTHTNAGVNWLLEILLSTTFLILLTGILLGKEWITQYNKGYKVLQYDGAIQLLSKLETKASSPRRAGHIPSVTRYPFKSRWTTAQILFTAKARTNNLIDICRGQIRLMEIVTTVQKFGVMKMTACRISERPLQWVTETLGLTMKP